MAISSTDCRDRVAGAPVWYLVPDGVVQYISKAAPVPRSGSDGLTSRFGRPGGYIMGTTQMPSQAAVGPTAASTSARVRSIASGHSWAQVFRVIIAEGCRSASCTVLTERPPWTSNVGGVAPHAVGPGSRSPRCGGRTASRVSCWRTCSSGLGSRRFEPEHRGARRRTLVEEQDVSEVGSGESVVHGEPLGQFGELQNEVERDTLKPLWALFRCHMGDDLSHGGVTGLRVVIVGQERRRAPHGLRYGGSPSRASLSKIHESIASR